MIRQGLSVCYACVILGLAAAPGAQAQPPPGPRLAITALSPSEGTIFSAGSDGSEPLTIAKATARGHRLTGPVPYGPPAWLPSGEALVFPGVVSEPHPGRSSGLHSRLFVVPAAGGVPRPLPGTAEAEGPVVSPDGHTIAFLRRRRKLSPSHRAGGTGSASATWLVDLAGGRARQLTPWQSKGHALPSSFSPDGLSLALTRVSAKGQSDAISIRLDTGAETMLARNALEPVYSPDGSEIALLRGNGKLIVHGSPDRVTDLFVVKADGSEEKQVTRTPNGIEIWPRWDPSGHRIAFTRLNKTGSVEALLGFDDSILEANADGTCPTTMFSNRMVSYRGAVWQPGPGREAPPLSC